MPQRHQIKQDYLDNELSLFLNFHCFSGYAKIWICKYLATKVETNKVFRGKGVTCLSLHMAYLPLQLGTLYTSL